MIAKEAERLDDQRRGGAEGGFLAVKGQGREGRTSGGRYCDGRWVLISHRRLSGVISFCSRKVKTEAAGFTESSAAVADAKI